MREIVETIEYKGYTIKIYPDEMAADPREWENLGKMVCFHGRYNLGDKHDYKTEDFDGWKEMSEHLIKEEGALVILPLYLYDHSGITMSTGSFSCPWDSGQVGFIYADKKMILDFYGGKKVTKAKLKRVEKGLRAEVEVYDSWISGSCYGWNADDPDGDEIDDSCWGYYGYNWKENGLREAAENAIDCEIEKREKEAEEDRLAKVRKAKALVRNRVPLERRWA